jgi:hypothetical protein
MIPIESIYEIESDLHDLQPYLHLKSTWVVRRAREHYEQLVERIFKEHGRFVDPEQRSACLHDDKYFLCPMKSTRINYYSDTE